MSTIGTVANFLLSGLELVEPQFAPAIEIAKRLEPFVEDGIPLLKAAITQGPAAYAAAKKAAPDFFNGLQQLADRVKANITGDAAAIATDHEVAAYGAHIAGVDPPGWAHEATERWWNQASGSNTSS